MAKAGQSVPVVALAVGACLFYGCSPSAYRKQADEVAANIIRQKQMETLGHAEPFTVERPADTLRRRLMIDQKLQREGPASLGTHDLEPVKHWPNDNYPQSTTLPADPMARRVTAEPLRLSLLDALQVAAHNSQEYQTRKETIFQDALVLDLARDEFRPFFSGTVSGDITRDLAGDKGVTGAVVSPGLGFSQKFANGTAVSLNIVQDLAKLLTGDKSAAMGLAADMSISMPLLRGAGEFVVTEPLTQAERNVAYDLLEFEHYKRTFAVSIAGQFFAVLQRYDILQNADESYRRAVVQSARSQALAQAGRLPPFQMDQAISDELGSRDIWIAAQGSFSDSMDSFKVLLGLPPDARVELDRSELQQLARSISEVLRIQPPPTSQPAVLVLPTTRITAEELQRKLATMPKPQDVVLTPPDPKDAGRFELPETQAIDLALKNRPDLRVAKGKVFDAQRQVAVAANALEAGLKLTAGGAAGSRRGIGSTGEKDAELRFEKGTYSAGFDLDLPLHRTAERDAYRASYIALEQAVRSFQAHEDNIKLDIRGRLTELLQAREALKTNTQAVIVAERRVASTDMLFEAGRVQVRDVLDASASLTRARNALTSALIRYRVAELTIERDLGLLEVNEEGLWREYKP